MSVHIASFGRKTWLVDHSGIFPSPSDVLFAIHKDLLAWDSSVQSDPLEKTDDKRRACLHVTGHGGHVDLQSQATMWIKLGTY